MIYPEFLKEKAIIGVTAPSDGTEGEPEIYRLNQAIKKVEEQGFKVLETANIRSSELGRSSSALERAKQFEELITNEDVKAIIHVSGGDFQIETLPYLNFDLIKENPKWIQGYSDPTNYLFTITTNLDIATIYSYNFKPFGMKDWHQSLYNNLEILKGNIIKQDSFDLYENDYREYVIGDENFNLNAPVKWDIVTGEKEVEFSGRIIGGCLDILLELIGTKYDNTKSFVEKYKDDGIIWYFDNFGVDCEHIVRCMLQLREAGWFNHVTGIVFGRSLNEESCYGVSFNDSVLTGLKDLNVPVITNADIGHKSPMLTIINGAVATIKCSDGKGSIEYELR